MAEKTQEGTLIGPDEIAVVISANGSWNILLPEGDDDAELPEQAAALLAAAIRLSSDAAFYKEMLAWYAARRSEDAAARH